MKLVSTFFAVLVSASSAQTPSTAFVIKDGVGPVVFLRFSPDGGELARICQFGPVMLFDTNGYRKARTFSVGMRMIAYSPDRTRMATAEGTDGARIWEAAAKGKPMPESVMIELHLLDAPLQVLEAPGQDRKQQVLWAEFSPDGKLLITTQANGHVKIWNTSSWAVEQEPILTDGEVLAAVFAPDSKTFMVGDSNGVLHLWSLATKAEIKTLRTPASAGAIRGVAFAPDGKWLVTTNQSAGVMIWNTASWIAQVESGFGAAAFSKDGKLLALGGNHIRLIDPSRLIGPSSLQQIRSIELPELTLRESGRLFEKQPNADKKFPISIQSLAFSPDGSILAAGCLEGTVRLVKMTP